MWIKRWVTISRYHDFFLKVRPPLKHSGLSVERWKKGLLSRLEQREITTWNILEGCIVVTSRISIPNALSYCFSTKQFLMSYPLSPLAPACSTTSIAPDSYAPGTDSLLAHPIQFLSILFLPPHQSPFSNFFVNKPIFIKFSHMFTEHKIKKR